jgi:hypothetical protein
MMRRWLCTLAATATMAGCAGTWTVTWDRPTQYADGAALPVDVPLRYGVLLGGARTLTTTGNVATVATPGNGQTEISVEAETETTVIDSAGTNRVWQTGAAATPIRITERPAPGKPEKARVQR